MMELKALLRQLGDLERNVLIYMLRFMVDVSAHQDANGASRECLSEVRPRVCLALLTPPLMTKEGQGPSED